MMETCAMCGGIMACGHSVALDAGRRFWRLCCLCTGELVGKLDRDPEQSMTIRNDPE